MRYATYSLNETRDSQWYLEILVGPVARITIQLYAAAYENIEESLTGGNWALEVLVQVKIEPDSVRRGTCSLI